MKKNILPLLACGAWLLSCNGNSLGPNGDNGDLTGLTDIRIEPADITLEATPSQPAMQTYKAIGVFPGGEKDLSAVATFYADNGGIGYFTQAQFSGANMQGGDTQVHASAGNITGNAHLVVHFSATVKAELPGGANPLPADPSTSFNGTANTARAPQLVYPNDGVMLPPNISSLEVHWKPGAAQNNLYQLTFNSPTTNVTTYTRCGTMVNNGCIFALDSNTYSYVANSNAGSQPVSLLVRGSDDAGTGFGESAQFSMQFAQENVNGGLYYWTTTGKTAIMRVDFGSANQTPEKFLSPDQDNLPTCVGCHAVSRDGSRMVSSLGGQGDGRQVYIADLAQPQASRLTLNGQVPASQTNHIQFASFNPTGSRFVAVYGDTNTAPEMNTLFMHDANTGLRIPTESVVLNYEPDHPDWSPNGSLIAFAHVGTHNTSQRPRNCGIDVMAQNGATWNAPSPVLPIAAGKNRYHPNFAPDSSFLIYSESICPGGDINNDTCDGDADPPAKSWVVMPTAGATPVQLTRIGKQGIMDTQADLSDTYPRFSPFQQKQGSGRLFWVTISSRRKAGLRDPGAYNGGLQWLWMFAIDPDKVAAGQDGSYPGFFLPFQDLTTSNHLAQWTEKVVGGAG